MNEMIIWNIEDKYKNNVIVELPIMIIEYLHIHPNYFDLFMSKYITVNDILYFLRNKLYKSKVELMNLIIKYIEVKHGIFK